MPEELTQRIAAKVVIEAQGGILVLHPSDIDLNRNWHIPGGIRDDMNELLVDTGLREVREETKIQLTGAPFRPFKVGEWTGEDKGQEVKILAIFFHVVLPKRPEVVLSHEHDDYVWLDKRNYKKYQSNQEVYEIVEELL